MSASTTLAERIQPALDRQAKSIPAQAKLQVLPGPEILNVREVVDQSGLLTASELVITNYTASELVRLIARGDLTSEACTWAFIKRAGIATQLVNCCTEIYAAEALARAKELDQYFKDHGKTVGPLHGLPVSIKEHILWKDKVVHCSYVAWMNNIEPENGLVLDVMLECGAVPFCRTPQPQSVM